MQPKEATRNSLSQMDLFDVVHKAYLSDVPLSNEQLYRRLSETAGIPEEVWSLKEPVGASGQLHSVARRKIRWHQQNLRRAGLIERVPGSRGVWRSVLKSEGELTEAPANIFAVAYSTKLGVALWGYCKNVFAALDEPIHLCLTSPPYCLSQPRKYGNPRPEDYVDFVCQSLEPICKNLIPGGSIALNISNDIFERGSPARSLYRERLVIALYERLGLSKMDELIWENKSKAPGPIAWASKKRVQLNTVWEPVYWFTNDPSLVQSDNRRVLQAHSETHKKLIQSGGEKRRAIYGDGANRIRPGSFANPTEGKIPRNILSYGHRCAHQAPARNAMEAAGFPVHGAAMPFALADFLVKFLTVPGQTVVDPFSGLGTTAEAAEANGCRWVTSEKMFEYAWASSFRFQSFDGFCRDLKV